MTVITRSRTASFAIIPNAVAEDKRLSFEARGVLCYLLAKPNNWQVQISDIKKQGNFGRDSFIASRAGIIPPMPSGFSLLTAHLYMRVGCLPTIEAIC